MLGGLPAAAQVQNSENTLKLAEGASSPAASIADLAWLTGYWRGDGFGGHCEEAWGDPLGDRMLGWFSVRKEEELTFSEAVAIVEKNGSLEVWVKHFNADFSGWEEKDDFVRFPLVKMGDQEAYFQGLTYRRVGDNLEIFVVVGSDGKNREAKLTLKRASF